MLEELRDVVFAIVTDCWLDLVAVVAGSVGGRSAARRTACLQASRWSVTLLIRDEAK